MKVGLIGAGAIATYLLEELNANGGQDMKVTSVLVRDFSKYAYLEEKYNIRLHTDLEEFLQSPADIVVEAANVEAVREMLPRVLKRKDTIIISIGALVEKEFLQEIRQIADLYHKKLYLPAGAIGGLDLVQNVAATGILDSAELITRKPANTLLEEPTEKAEIVFEGKAKKAIEKYPRNMNVSIALALAGIGFDRTKVTLIADPEVTENIHSIRLQGEFGHAQFTITNKPLPSNPSTSYLAAVSIIGALQKESKQIRIG